MMYLQPGIGVHIFLWDIPTDLQSTMLLSSVAGDDSVTSALRELEEELGIKANKEQLQYILTAKLRHVLNNGSP